MSAIMDFFSDPLSSVHRSSWGPESILKKAPIAAAVRKAFLLLLLATFLQFLFALQPALSGCSSKAREDVSIVLDVGHTAAAPGVSSARGVPEHDFNMNLAQRINQELLSAGFRSTYLMVTNT